MQQRRVRLGDILDDYCPRERRITNHAVVAMIDDEVKQTRCTTCDADHEYKDAKVPIARRRKSDGVLAGIDGAARPELIAHDANVPPDDDAGLDLEPDEAIEPAAAPLFAAPIAVDEIVSAGPADHHEDARSTSEDEWPVHRPLIRATLPRPEGHVPERKEPDFTMRQNRFEGNRNGQRHARGHRRQAQGQSGSFGQYGQRQSGPGGERNGNRAPQPGQRGGRHGGGPGSGQRQGGGGRGPKRGR